jgi:hypothetical protein
MAGIREGRRRNPPAWLTMFHGLPAAAGLTLLLYAAFARGDVPHSGSASEQLGWPDNADSAGKVAFFEYLENAGLPLPENRVHNAIAGEIA